MHDKEHITEEHRKEISEAKNYQQLSIVALKVLKDMPKPISQVCGPFSTGGLGDIEKNRERVRKVTEKLLSEGHNIFNWWNDFEKQIGKIRKTSEKKTSHETNQELLDEFYKTLQESGYIETMYFIPGWESSHGASWEREQAKRLGIKIVDLTEEYFEE
jgi:hypothetical protein